MEYPYQAKVIYSARRTLALCITREGVLLVRAPYRTGEKQILDMIVSHDEWIRKNLKKVEKKMATEEGLSEEKIRELKKLAKDELPDLTRYYANIMGLDFGRITITSAKTRFGSCSSQKNISYSYRLMLYPREAREYVVVHELCHLVEMNHSRRFYALVAKVMPDYKERRKLLK